MSRALTHDAPSAALHIHTAVGLTLVAALVAAEWREDIEDFIFTSSFQTSGASDFGFGDGVGAALWSLALWYCSPLQLLLLFWGQFERERPSDWVMRQLGQAAGLPVDAVDYSAPLTLRGAALAFTALCGVGTAWAFSLALGDATWSVSSGIGACIASAVYEGGRPSRLDPEKAQLLENQYQDFAAFADVRLQRMGNCHESEVFKAFRREVARCGAGRCWLQCGATNKPLGAAVRGLVMAITVDCTTPEALQFTARLLLQVPSARGAAGLSAARHGSQLAPKCFAHLKRLLQGALPPAARGRFHWQSHRLRAHG